MGRFRALAFRAAVLVGCWLATSSAGAETPVIEYASGTIFAVPNFSAPVVAATEAAGFTATATGDFAVGPNADFHGWFRFPETGGEPPQTAGDFLEIAEPLLADDLGEARISLLHDFGFGYTASFRCPELGRPESWQTFMDKVSNTILRQDIGLAFDAGCNFNVFQNNELMMRIPGEAGLQVEILALAPLPRCDTKRLGTWTFTMAHKGQTFPLIGTGMTGFPEVRRGPGELRVSALFPPIHVPEIHVEVPGSAVGELWETAPTPGESLPVNIAAFDIQCNVAVPSVPVTVKFEFLASSGGHAHQMVNRPAVPGPGAQQQMVLASVTPPQGATFSNATATLTGTTPAPSGVLTATITAGQVSGVVRITAEAPAAPMLTPAVEDIAVKQPRLSSLVANPDHYRLIGATANHPDNHFVSDVLNVAERIDDLALEFQVNSILDTPSRNYLLQLNDASLVTGGLFDLDDIQNGIPTPFWQPSHDEHRTGMEIDVSYRVFDVEAGRQRQLPPVVVDDMIDDIAPRFVFPNPEHPRNHTHLRFR